MLSPLLCIKLGTFPVRKLLVKYLFKEALVKHISTSYIQNDFKYSKQLSYMKSVFIKLPKLLGISPFNLLKLRSLQETS